MEDKKIWDDPDPRIKWALDLFDNHGTEPISLLSYYWMPFVGGGSIYIGRISRNAILRRPLYTGTPLTIGLSLVGFGAGILLRDYLYKKNVTENGILQHYMMLHPEKFPEPEVIKYGDKRCFLPWRSNR